MPDPAGLYDRVQVGDIGYVYQGQFLRMFNALLPANDRTQVLGVPKGIVPLEMGPFNNIRTQNCNHGHSCSNTLMVDYDDKRPEAYVTSYYPAQHYSYAMDESSGPDRVKSVSFKCGRSKNGSILFLPYDGVSEDAIRILSYERYILEHCDSWLEFATVNNLAVDKFFVKMKSQCKPRMAVCVG